MSRVIVCCLSYVMCPPPRGELHDWITFDCFELKGCNFQWWNSTKKLPWDDSFFNLTTPTNPNPQPPNKTHPKNKHSQKLDQMECTTPYPHPKPPQCTNFAKFGPIWMALGVEVKYKAKAKLKSGSEFKYSPPHRHFSFVSLISYSLSLLFFFVSSNFL